MNRPCPGDGTTTASCPHVGVYLSLWVFIRDGTYSYSYLADKIKKAVHLIPKRSVVLKNRNEPLFRAVTVSKLSHRVSCFSVADNILTLG